MVPPNRLSSGTIRSTIRSVECSSHDHSRGMVKSAVGKYVNRFLNHHNEFVARIVHSVKKFDAIDAIVMNQKEHKTGTVVSIHDDARESFSLFFYSRLFLHLQPHIPLWYAHVRIDPGTNFGAKRTFTHTSIVMEFWILSLVFALIVTVVSIVAGMYYKRRRRQQVVMAQPLDQQNSTYTPQQNVDGYYNNTMTYNYAQPQPPAAPNAGYGSPQPMHASPPTYYPTAQPVAPPPQLYGQASYHVNPAAVNWCSPADLPPPPVVAVPYSPPESPPAHSS